MRTWNKRCYLLLSHVEKCPCFTYKYKCLCLDFKILHNLASLAFPTVYYQGPQAGLRTHSSLSPGHLSWHLTTCLFRSCPLFESELLIHVLAEVCLLSAELVCHSPLWTLAHRINPILHLHAILYNSLSHLAWQSNPQMLNNINIKEVPKCILVFLHKLSSLAGNHILRINFQKPG